MQWQQCIRGGLRRASCHVHSSVMFTVVYLLEHTVPQRYGKEARCLELNRQLCRLPGGGGAVASCLPNQFLGQLANARTGAHQQDVPMLPTCPPIPAICGAPSGALSPFCFTDCLQVEHMRRLRQLAEEEADLTAQQLQLQAERQAVAAAAGMQNVQEAAQAQLAR